MDNLMTVAEAAKVLRLQPCTIRSWIGKRKLPFLKIGARVFLRRADVEAFLDSSLIPARKNNGSVTSAA